MNNTVLPTKYSLFSKSIKFFYAVACYHFMTPCNINITVLGVTSSKQKLSVFSTIAGMSILVCIRKIIVRKILK